jgi:hypothetical protein
MTKTNVYENKIHVFKKRDMENLCLLKWETQDLCNAKQQIQDENEIILSI